MNSVSYSYDPYLAFSLCSAYRESKDKEVLEILLKQLVPLIDMVLKSEVRSLVHSEDSEMLKCDALVKVYEVISAFDIPSESPSGFTSFLYTVIHRSFIDSLRRSKSKVFDIGSISLVPTSGRLRSHKDVEDSIYINQFILLVQSLLEQDIRYTGKERSACVYMSQCMLGINHNDPMSAQHIFRLSKHRCKYLAQYIQILLRSISCWLRELDEAI